MNATPKGTKPHKVIEKKNGMVPIGTAGYKKLRVDVTATFYRGKRR